MRERKLPEGNNGNGNAIFVEADAQTRALSGEKIAVLGYGSQGRAHALNLRDSGYDVVIGVRPRRERRRRRSATGSRCKTPAEAVKGAGLVAFLAPDMAQAQLYKDIEPNLGKGATLLFAHGFNIHYKLIQPRADLDVDLIAPKGPGDLVRRQYEQGRGVPVS
jgi:ketol-acid reductoisomerase